MRAFLRFIAFLLVLAVLGGGIAWFWAGRSAGPTIAIKQPGQFVGQNSSLEMMVEAPEGKFTCHRRHGRTSWQDVPSVHAGPAARETSDRNRPNGSTSCARSARRRCPIFSLGPRASSCGHRARCCLAFATSARQPTHDVTVRLEPPQVAVLSTFHYVNHGGSEFVVYRATPADVESGVRVGNIEYPGFPATRGRNHQRPGVARRVLRAALRSGPEHRLPGVRARPGRQRGARLARSSGLPEALLEEPHRDRRSLHRSCRAGHRQQLAPGADSDRRLCCRDS